MVAAITNGADGGYTGTSATFDAPGTAFGGNNLCLFALVSGVASGTAEVPTSVNDGDAWTLVNSVLYNGNLSILSLWRKLSGSPASAGIVVDWAASQVLVSACYISFSGVKTTGTNGADAIVQSVTATGADPSPTLAAYGHASNVTMAVIGAETTGEAASGFTFLNNGSNSANNPNSSWLDGQDTTVTYTQGTPAAAIAIEIAADVATLYEQEGYRWRNDDASESAATWAAAQDTLLTAPVTSERRLRGLVNTTNDAPSQGYTLQYRRTTDSIWRDVRKALP